MSAIHQTGWPADRPSVEVRFRCEVVAVKRAELIEQLAEILREEGFFVAPAQKWEKKIALLSRLQLQHEAFDRIVAHPSCPPVDIDRANGGRGRVVAVSSNPLFEAFVDAHRGRKYPPRQPLTIAEGRPSRAKPDAELKRNRKGLGRKAARA